jgi:hypothetical protein
MHLFPSVPNIKQLFQKTLLLYWSFGNSLLFLQQQKSANGKEENKSKLGRSGAIL